MTMNIRPVLVLMTLLTAAAQAPAANLIVNGNMESGNTGFTSGYAFSPGVNNAEGQYAVLANPNSWNTNLVSPGDHTSGTGLMMAINGATTTGVPVWTSTLIDVLPDTDYFFDAFVTSVCCNASYTGANNSPNLEFTANGQSLGSILVSVDNPGTWQGFSKTWNSGAATTVTLSLVNLQTAAGGNDFALDDLSLDTTTTVPAPAALPLLLTGLAAALRFFRRRGVA